MNTIYINQYGLVRLEANEENMTSITVTQEQYEKILGLAMFLEHCLTPLSNYQDYKNGDTLKDADIPEQVYFADLYKNENASTEITKGQFERFVTGLISRINNDYFEEYHKYQVYVGDTVYSYTDKDRLDLNIYVSNNLGGYFNDKKYSAEELKTMFYLLENELARLAFYRQVLIDLCHEITFEQYKASEFTEPVWGLYNDVVEEKMNGFEKPFK